MTGCYPSTLTPTFGCVLIVRGNGGLVRRETVLEPYQDKGFKSIATAIKSMGLHVLPYAYQSLPGYLSDCRVTAHPDTQLLILQGHPVPKEWQNILFLDTHMDCMLCI